MSNRGAAAIVFQPLATVDFDQVVRDMEEVVKATAADSATTVERSDDSYGFRWLILRGKDFESLVVGVNAISSALRTAATASGCCARCSAFPIATRGRCTGSTTTSARTFYPFIPTSGTEQRDSERELVVKAQVGSRAARRARTRALVSPLGNPDLGGEPCQDGWWPGPLVSPEEDPRR